MADQPGEWWQHMFDEDWIKIFAYKNRDTRKEVRGIRELLGLGKGSKILDVACGEGRIAIGLAQMGFQVTGVDVSESLIKSARKKSRRKKLDISWLHRDMRELDIKDQYDAAVNIFTSFGYFENENENIKALRSICSGLKKSGKLILDLENMFFIARVSQICGCERMYRPIDNYQGWVEELTEFKPLDQRVNMKLRMWYPEKGLFKSGEASYRVFSFREMQNLLDLAGFTTHSVYGGFDLSPYKIDSERMIVLSFKS